MYCLAKFDELCSLQIDDFIHNLMLSIANTQPLKAWDDEFHNLIMVSRRLAFKHPFMIIRFGFYDLVYKICNFYLGIYVLPYFHKELIFSFLELF